MDFIRVDLDASAGAFGLAEDLPPFDFGWHEHNKHQLLYSARGSMHLEAEGSQWLLPPQRAAWIRVGVPHRVRATQPVELRTINLPPSITRVLPTEACRVFAIPTLGREMILYAMRWTADRNEKDSLEEHYFPALAGLFGEWAQAALPFQLPTARTPELGRAMEYTLANLETPKIAAAARAAGMSPRTLARRFADEMQMTWQQWMQAARMLRAMELLSVKGARVTEAGFEVGYTSPGGFSHAFAAFAGETPTEYRRRAQR